MAATLAACGQKENESQVLVPTTGEQTQQLTGTEVLTGDSLTNTGAVSQTGEASQTSTWSSSSLNQSGSVNASWQLLMQPQDQLKWWDPESDELIKLFNELIEE